MLNQEDDISLNVEAKTPSPLSSLNDRSTNDEEENPDSSSSGSSPFELKKRLEELPSRSEVTRLAKRISAISRRLIRKRDIHFHLQGTTERIEEKDEKEEKEQQEQDSGLGEISFKLKDARARRRARIQQDITKTIEETSLTSRSDPASALHKDSRRNLPADFKRQSTGNTEMWLGSTVAPLRSETRCQVPGNMEFLSDFPNNFADRRLMQNSPVSPSSLRTSRPIKFGGYRPVPGTFLRNLSSDSEESSSEFKQERTAYLGTFSSPSRVQESPVRFTEASDTRLIFPRANRSREINLCSTQLVPDVNDDHRASAKIKRCFEDANRRPSITDDGTLRKENTEGNTESYISSMNFPESISDPCTPSNKKDPDSGNRLLTPLSSSRTIPQEAFTHQTTYELEVFEDSRNNNYAMTNFNECNETLPAQSNLHSQSSDDDEHAHLRSIIYLFNEKKNSCFSDTTARSRNSSDSVNNFSDCPSLKNPRPRAQTSCESSPMDQSGKRNVKTYSHGSPLRIVQNLTEKYENHCIPSTTKRILPEEMKESFQQSLSASPEEESVSNNAALSIELEDKNNEKRNNDTCEERIPVDVPALVLNSQEISYSTSPGSKSYSENRLDANALFAALSNMSARSKPEEGDSAAGNGRKQLLPEVGGTSKLKSSGNNSMTDGSSLTGESFESKIPRRKRSRIPVKINCSTYRASSRIKRDVEIVGGEESPSAVAMENLETFSERTRQFLVRDRNRDRFNMGIDINSYAFRKETEFSGIPRSTNADFSESLNLHQDNSNRTERIGDTSQMESRLVGKPETAEKLSSEINQKSHLEYLSATTDSTKTNSECETPKRYDKLRYSAESLAANEFRKYVSRKPLSNMQSETDGLIKGTVPLNRIQYSSSTSRLHRASDKLRTPQYSGKRSQDRFPFTISERNSGTSSVLRDGREYASLERERKPSGNVYELKLHPSLTRLAGTGTEETPSEIMNYVARTELRTSHHRLSAVKRFMRRFSAKFKKSWKQGNGTGVVEANVIYKNNVYQTESTGNSCSESSLVEDLRYEMLGERYRSDRNSPDKESSIVVDEMAVQRSDSKDTTARSEHPCKRHKCDNLWVREITDTRVKIPGESERRNSNSQFFIKGNLPSNSEKDKRGKESFSKGKRKILPRSNSLPTIFTPSDTVLNTVKDKGSVDYRKENDEDATSESEKGNGCICCRICPKFPRSSFLNNKHSVKKGLHEKVSGIRTGRRKRRRSWFSWRKRG